MLSIAGVTLLYHPLIPYDSWWYHLPFAARQWGLAGASGFTFDPILQERWLGFPKAWTFLQGLGWSVLGSIRGVVLPQLLLVALFLWFLNRTYGLTAGWIALGLFASPLLLIHFQATYLDLPVGLCIAIGLLALLDIIDAARGARGQVLRIQACIAVASIGLAGNIKYHGLVAAGLAVTVAGLMALLTPGIAPRRRLAIVGVSALAMMVASLSPTWNVIRTGNPLYPMTVTILGKTLLTGTESPDMDASPPTYLLVGERDFQFPGPVNHVLSLTELDWTMRGVAAWYNIDGFSGRLPRRGAPSRTGGLGQTFVLFHLGLLVWQIMRWRVEQDTRQRILIVGTCALLVGLAIVPRAHELRYWLAGPLVLVVVNLRYVAALGWPTPMRLALAGLCCLGIALAVLSPRSEIVVRRPVDPAAIRAEMPPHIREALQRDGRFCDADDDLLFRFGEAVSGVPGRLSRNPSDCR